MFCELDIPFEIFTALVALERFHPRVRPNVALKMTRRSASVVTLVTLERLFSCVHPHNVNFQCTSSNERRLAHCASVRLFPRVGFFCDPSDCLIELQHNRIGCTAVASLQCVS